MNKLIGRTSHRLCTFSTSIREIREIKYYFNIWGIRKKKERRGLRKKGGWKFTHFTSPGSAPARTRKFSQLFKITAWETFSYHGYALRLIFMHWLVKICQVSSCLCNILKLVSTSFVSTCDVFNCFFPLDVQNELQLLSRVLCYSCLVCFLGFWLRNASLVKVGKPILGGIVFVFHHAWIDA